MSQYAEEFVEDHYSLLEGYLIIQPTEEYWIPDKVLGVIYDEESAVKYAQQGCEVCKVDLKSMVLKMHDS